MEKDDELKGIGNSYDFGARMYDSRVGRWFAIDKHFAKYPSFSPYIFSFNSPLRFVDLDGNDGVVTGSGTKEDPYIIKSTYFYIKGQLDEKFVEALNNGTEEFNQKDKNGQNKIFEIKDKNGKKVYVSFNLNVIEVDPLNYDGMSTEEIINEVRFSDEYIFYNKEGRRNSSANYVEQVTAVKKFSPNTAEIDADALAEADNDGFDFKINNIDSFKSAIEMDLKSLGVLKPNYNMSNILQSLVLHEIYHNLGGKHEDKVAEMKIAERIIVNKQIGTSGDDLSRNLQFELPDEVTKEGVRKLFLKINYSRYVDENNNPSNFKDGYRRAVIEEKGPTPTE